MVNIKNIIDIKQDYTISDMLKLKETKQDYGDCRIVKNILKKKED